MKKLESTLANMVIVLFVITLIAGLSLGAVNNVTKGPIALANQQKTIKAIENVCPKFNNTPNEDKFEKEFENLKDKIVIYTAKDNDNVVGYAVQTFSNKAFNGKLKLMVGISPDFKVSKVSVLYQGETPGLGTKMEEPTFLNQFDGVDLKSFDTKVSKDGGDVDAITAATISSRAFCDAVVRAKTELEDYLSKK